MSFNYLCETLESASDEKVEEMIIHNLLAGIFFYSRIWIGISNSFSGSIGNAATICLTWHRIQSFLAAPFQDRLRERASERLYSVVHIIIPYEMNSNSVKLIQKVFRLKKHQAIWYTNCTIPIGIQQIIHLFETKW